MTDYIEIRHQLHEHPQTAGDEQFAHDTIVRHLQQLHPDKVYTHVGGYGVVAVWGKEPGAPTIAFRADTDALPIGHRCGHDGHTTILLRLAELIDEVFSAQCSVCSDATRDGDSQLNTKHSTLNTDKNLLLLWQPAEETGCGARAMMESGVLQQYDIRAIYGFHNLPGYPLGTVVLCPHTFAAASTGVIYHLDGRETHASTPELGLNPGLAVSEIIDTFSAFNGQEGEFRQSTLICVRLGNPAFGTSAGHADVMFTLRAFTNAAMERLLADANNAVDGIARRHGLRVTRMLQEPFHATENDAARVEDIRKAAGDLSLRVVDREDPMRWSEDFAEYLMQYSGAMFGMGSGDDHAELHHPDYDFPDELIEVCASVLATLCRSFRSSSPA